MARMSGDIPHFMRPLAMLNRSRLHYDTQWEWYPLLRTFFPLDRMVRKTAEQFILPEMENLMLLGSFHAQPGTPDGVAQSQLGTKLVRPLFQDLADPFPSNYAAQVAAFDNGEPPFATDSTLGEGMLADLESEFDRYQQGQVEIINRGWALWASKLFSSGSSYTITVDGVTVTHAYSDVNTDTASASWATAGTDVVLDMQSFVETHFNACGMMPTHAIVGNDVLPHLAQNTEYRKFGERYPEFMRSHVLPTIGLNMKAPDGSDSMLQEILMGDAYKDSTGTVTKMWPDDTITLVTAVPNLTVHATSRNAKNEMQGGMHSWRYTNEETKETRIFTSDNKFMGFGAPQCVTICDIS